MRHFPRKKRTRESRDPCPVLPSSLLNEISGTPALESVGSIGSTRRQLRKVERKKKRERKKGPAYTAPNESKAKKARVATSTSLDASSAANQQPSVQNVYGNNRTSPASKPVEKARERLHASIDNASADQCADSRSSFEELSLSETRVPGATQSIEHVKDDSEADEARRLEALLGIGRSKSSSKSRRSYRDVFGEGDDDLLDLLEFCDKTNEKLRKVQREDTEHPPNEDESSCGPGSEKLESVCNALAVDDMQEGLQNGVAAGVAFRCQDASAGSGDSSPNENNSKRCAVTETEHHGVLEHSEVSDTASEENPTSKPWRPSVSARATSSNRVDRALRGLLNRMSEANAPSIGEKIVALFRNGEFPVPRRELAKAYANAALDLVSFGGAVRVTSPYITPQVAIAVYVGNNVDKLVLATFLVEAVRRLADCLTSGDVSASNENCKQSHGFGYLAVLSSLYTNNVITTGLMHDVIKFVAERLTEERLELLVMVLRHVATQLRKADPLALKDIIECTHEQVARLKVQGDPTGKKEGSDSKSAILLAFLDDVKNNKTGRTVLDGGKRKWWAGTLDAPLNACVSDLLSDEFTSTRWWDQSTGLTFAERMSKTELPSVSERESVTPCENARSVVTLPRALRLNTGGKKAIFSAIMSSTSASDAFFRLDSLHTFSDKHRVRDAAQVILRCCGLESRSNPFYATLAERFCRHSRQGRFALEFAFFDEVKILCGSQGNDFKRVAGNCAYLIGRLWAREAMPLSSLRRVGDFEECSSKEKRFYFRAMERLISELVVSDGAKVAPFVTLASERWNGVEEFRTSLAMFLRRHVHPRVVADSKAFVSKAVASLEA